MIITNVSSTYLSITSDEITAIQAAPNDYTKVEITGSINCGTPITKTLLHPFNATADISLMLQNILQINPSFFGLTELANGVVKISLKIFDDTGSTFITNCALVDIDLACKVAALLHNILAEYESKLEERPSSIAHLLHYSLVNGSNCGCNCADMCKNYDALIDILTNIDPTLLADCGC